jgi:hypothetical protein
MKKAGTAQTAPPRTRRFSSMSKSQNSAVVRVDVTPDELEAAYAWLSEARQAIADGVPCDAGDCIERAMVALGI